MKNTFLLLLALLPFITFSGASAQTVNPLFHHIPADADQVYHINLTSLGSKLDWSTLSSLLKGRNLGKAKLPFDIMSLLNSGLDFHQDVVITRSNLYFPDSLRYTTILVHLTDSGKFVAFLRSNGHEFHIRQGHDRVATDNQQAYAWTDKIAVMVIANSPKANTVYPPVEHNIAHKAITALHGSANTYFVTDTRFITGLSGDGDMQVWNRHAGNLGMLTKMLQGAPGNAQLNGLTQLAAKSGSGSTIGTLRFEPGKISYHLLRSLSPKELAGLQHIAGQGLSQDLVAAAPPGKLMALVALHFDMASLIDSLKGNGTIDSLNSRLSKSGLGVDDLLHALKGDFMLLAYNPDNTTDGSPAKTPGLYAMVSLADPSAFTRLAHGVKLTDATAPADPSVPDTAHHGMFSYYAQHNDIAVIGGDRHRLSTFFDHPATSDNPAGRLLPDRSRADIFSMGIDMHATADFLKPLLTKSDTIAAKNQSLLDAIRQMDLFLISSGGTKNGDMEADFQLRMTNKDRNGLASLMDILGKLSAKPAGGETQ